MNRRDALKTAAGTIAGLLLPTWKLSAAPRPIDLSPFCDSCSAYVRWNASSFATPFVQAIPSGQLYTFATDGKIGIKVDARDVDKGSDDILRPPIASLTEWRREGIWRPWPKPRLTHRSTKYCYACRGRGRYGQTVRECPDCEGYGCDKCQHKGAIGGAQCPHCNGTGKTDEPNTAIVGTTHVDRYYFEAVAKLPGAEFLPPLAEGHAMPFRFEGGKGLVMPLIKP